MSGPNYNSHPLPGTPPQQRQGLQYGQQQPSTSSSSYQRPPPQPHQNPPPTAHSQSSRKSRGFSFKSEKSHKSHKSTDSGHHHRKLSETSAEKESRRLHSKADPTLAISEAEPGLYPSTTIIHMYVRARRCANSARSRCRPNVG